MTDIAGRTALITGGANGIGLGIARAFSQAGAKLALVDLDEVALDGAYRELSQVTEVKTATLDVRARSDLANAADRFEETLGGISILVNNAGVSGGAPAEKLTYELWDWGMGINLGGVIAGVQTLLPRMLERREGGHIVNTACVGGLFGGPLGVLYHTAKFAVVGMSEALALELASSGIGVTVLCPGPVATDILDRDHHFQPNSRMLSPQQRTAAFARTQMMKAALARGASPDTVGDLALEAVRKNHLYAYTDNSFAEPVTERGRSLLDAMPRR
jgi:NAD(P)-dependent dehydrogenase (short-subunit alcohol dehydrogenase family)